MTQKSLCDIQGLVNGLWSAGTMAGGSGPEQQLRRLTHGELTDVLQSHLRFVSRKTGGRRALLSFHDLSDFDLSSANLVEADFTSARLQRSILTSAHLMRATLFAADLRMANLDHADLTSADLRGACFRAASLNGTILARADLREATLARHDRQQLSAVAFATSAADFTLGARG